MPRPAPRNIQTSDAARAADLELLDLLLRLLVLGMEAERELEHDPRLAEVRLRRVGLRLVLERLEQRREDRFSSQHGAAREHREPRVEEAVVGGLGRGGELALLEEGLRLVERRLRGRRYFFFLRGHRFYLRSAEASRMRGVVASLSLSCVPHRAAPATARGTRRLSRRRTADRAQFCCSVDPAPQTASMRLSMFASARVVRQRWSSPNKSGC